MKPPLHKRPGKRRESSGRQSDKALYFIFHSLFIILASFIATQIELIHAYLYLTDSLSVLPITILAPLYAIAVAPIVYLVGNSLNRKRTIASSTNVNEGVVRYNKSSVIGISISLFYALTSFFLPLLASGIAGLAGLILGIVATSEIKKTGEKGKNLAFAAILISIAVFIWNLLRGFLIFSGAVLG